MSNKSLSICIPTCNRYIYLQECLNSIYCQLNKELLKKIEIIISDNNSQDNTSLLIKKYREKYNNIFYFKNKRNIGAATNYLKAASYAKGRYIWFFSDDDLMKQQSLKEILSIIKSKPDIILCNYSKFIINQGAKKILFNNCFQVDKNLSFKSKKDYFNLLEHKFIHFYNILELLKLKTNLLIDSYTVFVSSVIIKKDIYKKNLEKINNKNLKSTMPYSGLYLYSNEDYSFFITRKILILNRLNNISWNKQNHYQTARYWYTLVKKHYQLILKYNKKYYSTKFKVLVNLRTLVACINTLRIGFMSFIHQIS